MAATPPYRIPGSFRDPNGHVYASGSRIFRTLSQTALEQVEEMTASGLLADLEASGKLWPSTLCPTSTVPADIAAIAPTASVLEHPRLPFISNPYEWPFSLLQRAALVHLDLHLEALERHTNLIDGSAYNIQFVGTRPVFIDTLSLVRYNPGDFWLGYLQFCEQFLNPLILASRLGLKYQPWYRGALEGIDVASTARLLRLTHKLSPGVLLHVVAHARLQKRSARTNDTDKTRRKLSKVQLLGMLRGLRSFIGRLKPRGLGVTFWREYELNNSYSPDETQRKADAIAAFVQTVGPQTVWDLGCNSGAFSEIALANGAKNAIGFDYDLGALEAAVSRADDKGLNLLPLYLDAANPSPNQGWRQAERMGMQDRANPQAILALAFVHHMAIGRNVPLTDLVDWFLKLAPSGIIEFVPKQDPMVRQMLSARKDIFPDYEPDAFRSILSARCKILKTDVVSTSGRELFSYTSDQTN